MKRTDPSPILLLPAWFLLVSAAGAVLFAQEESEPIPLYRNLGPYQRVVTTSSPMAQRYFNQGMQLAYGFGRSAAVRSFREAQQLDPGCAMCYWGEAWALGPYQNGRMNAEAGRKAYQAIRKALELSEQGTPGEKALIQAMAVRYEAEPKEENREELDRRYADALGEVVRQFPQDLDAATLLGEALIVLHPWELWLEGGRPRPETTEAVQVLESVLARSVKHAGACHLYIHAVEASPEPGRAEGCADLLADQMPGASHIQHMPSHIYMQVGRYGDAVRANQKAHYVDQMARLGRAAAIYASHNLHMLMFAAWMDGQSAVALQAARDLGRSDSNELFNYWLMLVRFGRWEQILELSPPPEDVFQAGLWHFSRGLAHLRKREKNRARVELEKLIASLESAPQDATYRSRRFRKVDLLAIARGILEGELAAAEDRVHEAVEALRKAVLVEDSLPYSEPENWHLPVRQVLGAVLFKAGRAVEAERVYREELEDHPENGWSLLGLEQSLRAQDKAGEADQVRLRFENAWARADVFLTASRF